MDWETEIARLKALRADAELGGGAARIEKQHAHGKLTARERLHALFDEGTFVETDQMMRSRCTDFGMDKKRRPGDGVITGYGCIHGRLAFAAAQDFTVSGGSLGETQAQKICRAMDRALDARAPFISINDSGGARIEEGIAGLAGYGLIFRRHTLASGIIPQISVILGPCAGGACYAPALTDFIFMTERNSQMYITGPSATKSVTGEVISAEELGGSAVHQKLSGVAHFVYPEEESCLAGVRQLLAYLPQNQDERPPHAPGVPVDRSGELTAIVPDNAKLSYDVRKVIETFVDQGSFLEIQPCFAPNIVIGLARLDGNSVGIVANQSTWMAGSIEMHASDKAARFVRFCDCFHIPLITLVDVPAFLPGSQQEHNGIIRHGAKLLYAFSEATVPRITVILRKAYGGAYIAMNSKSIGADVVYAWPIAEIAVMGASGAVEIIRKQEIAGAEDPQRRRAELEAEYNAHMMNPYVAAGQGHVDEVILPEETREKIAQALRMLEGKKRENPAKRHGNMPL